MYTQQNEMVVMTIPYGYFSCMYSLLFIDSSVKLICMHPHSFHTSRRFPVMCTSFICDSIVIIIDMHPTHIPLTHGFQGNKHVMDVNDPCLYIVCVGCPLYYNIISKINEACDEQLLSIYCYR